MIKYVFHVVKEICDKVNLAARNFTFPMFGWSEWVESRVPVAENFTFKLPAAKKFYLIKDKWLLYPPLSLSRTHTFFTSYERKTNFTLMETILHLYLTITIPPDLTLNRLYQHLKQTCPKCFRCWGCFAGESEGGNWKFIKNMCLLISEKPMNI